MCNVISRGPMKRLITSIFLISLSLSIPVHAADLFEQLDDDMREFESPDNEKIVQEYLAFVNDYLTEYDAWRQEYLNGFDNKQAKIINRWGETTNQEINNVEYSDNLDAREMIDYDKNEVVIELLVPVDTTEADTQKILASYIQENQTSTEEVQVKQQDINTNNIELKPIKFDASQAIAAKSIIKKQTVAYKKEAEMKGDELQEKLPQEVINQSVAKQKVLLEKEEAERLKKVDEQYAILQKEAEQTPPDYKILKYTAQLPQNSLSKRAEKYKAFAEKESKRFDIPVGLVMAIMHSESAFDPRAKSAVPAYGLMQIVPRTAGHDVNKLVRNIDKPMQVGELYIPDVNVETGVAYLDILDKRYLKSIKNPESRLYCTIAAYNTGAGNVAKVFNKTGNTRNINKAALVINTLTPDQVYDALMKNLPYDETKHYLKKVSNRISLYEVKTAI